MKKQILSLITSGLLILISLSACQNQNSKMLDQNLTSEEFISIASKAYVYGYPLVLMEYTKRSITYIPEPNIKGNVPVNQLHHLRTFPDHTFTEVVKPNVDPYYSLAWMDLGTEPLVLSIPQTERYYLLPLLDAFTNVFSVPGTRTTGTEARDFLVTGPFWKGKIPEGLEQIASPTNMVWLLGRIQVNSPEDGKNMVWPIQDGMSLVPLSQFGKEYILPQGISNEENKDIIPVNDVRSLSISDFFNLMSSLMIDNPPYKRDSTLIQEMASIGIIAGEKFDMSIFESETQKELNLIPEKVEDTWLNMAEKGDSDLFKNGWLLVTKGMGKYGTNYDFRAFIAYFGLGANLPEDAVYPSTVVDSEGNPLDGSEKYIIHFEKNDLPPVNAFWSLTAYDKRDLLVENPINRYAVGDRDKLTFNEDGSLDIYIQNSSPGADRESNWLPSPMEGRLNLTLRLYWPKQEVLDRSWQTPTVERVE